MLLNADYILDAKPDAKPNAKAAWAEIFDTKTGRFKSTAAKKQETLQSSNADQVQVTGQVQVADHVQVGPNGNTHQLNSGTISVIDEDLTAVLARASIKALIDADKGEDDNSKTKDADHVQVGRNGNTHQPSSSTISVIDGDLTAVLARASIKALADMDKDEDANSKIEDAGNRIEKWAQGIIQEAQSVVDEEFNQIVKDIST